jgi:uncharacterized membrane protein
VVDLQWHPMIVHFPLALILVAALCFFAARVARSSSLAHSLSVVGTWNLSLGAVFALLAVASGLIAAMHAHPSKEAAANIKAHLSWAIASGLVVLGLAIFRAAGISASSRPKTLFLILLGVASVALVITGFYGGQNVYRFGIGVSGHG